MGILMLGAAILLLLSKEICFKENTEESNKKFLIFTGIVLAVIFSCRNAVSNYGNDLNNYYRLFERAIKSDSLKRFLNNEAMEEGYVFLNWLIARVIKWPQFILVFHAVFCIGVTLRFIYSFSDDVLISVLGFMAFGVMQFYLTGFRQSFAIAICLIALELALKKKFIPFVITVFIASTVHQTAIIFIPIYWLVKLKLSKLYVFLDLAAIAVLYKFVPRLIAIGNEVFEREYQGKFGGNRLGGLINLLIGAAVLAVILYYSNAQGEKVLKAEDSKTGAYINAFFHMTLIGLGVYALRYQALVLERISLYFTSPLFILAPYAINTAFDKQSRRMLEPVFCAILLFLIWWRFGNISYEVFW